MVFGTLAQTVAIASVQVRVRGMLIEESLDEATRFSFGVDADANGGNVSGVVPGALVQVTQTVTGASPFDGPVSDSRTWVGIIEATRMTRVGGARIVAVEAVGARAFASRQRFFATWLGGSASDVVRDGWTNYGPVGLDLSGIQDGAPEISTYQSTFDTLADLMEFACASTGWVWGVDGLTVEFYDPLARTAGPIRRRDFLDGTIDVRQSLAGVFNVYRGIGYIYTRQTLSDPIPGAGDCVAAFRLSGSGISLGGGIWQLASAVPSSGTPADPGVNLSDFDGVYDPSENAIRFNFALRAGGGNPLPRATVTLKRPAWVEVADAASIAVYGPREAPPIGDDGMTPADEVERRMRALLDQSAWPYMEISGELARSDVRPGQTRRFDIPELGIDRDLIVTAVQRVTDGTELTVSISAVSQLDGGATASRARPRGLEMPEIVRRIERLERKDVAPLQDRGAWAIDLGFVTPVGPTVAGAWEWSGGFVAELVPEVDVAGAWEWVGAFGVSIHEEVDVAGAWQWGGLYDAFSIEVDAAVAVVAEAYEWAGAFEVKDVDDMPVLGDDMAMPA